MTSLGEEDRLSNVESGGEVWSSTTVMEEEEGEGEGLGETGWRREEVWVYTPEGLGPWEVAKVEVFREELGGGVSGSSGKNQWTCSMSSSVTLCWRAVSVTTALHRIPYTITYMYMKKSSVQCQKKEGAEQLFWAFGPHQHGAAQSLPGTAGFK